MASEPLPAGLRGEFFEEHELALGQPLPHSLGDGVIHDLTTDEVDAFLAVVAACTAR